MQSGFLPPLLMLKACSGLNLGEVRSLGCWQCLILATNPWVKPGKGFGTCLSRPPVYPLSPGLASWGDSVMEDRALSWNMQCASFLLFLLSPLLA